MTKIALIISLDLLRYKVEKTLNQFGLTDIQNIGSKMVSLATKNFIYTDVQLIIIDIDSADYDAMQVIANLKAGNKSSNIPILALGNSTDKTLITRLKSNGCAEYITKPIDDMTFASKVLQIIRQTTDNQARQDKNPIVANLKDTNMKSVMPSSLDDVKLKWSSAFETGIEDIDLEHKTIIENYEKLYQLMKSGEGHDFYNELLSFLTYYITTHFENEEKFQQDIGYDLYEEHKKRHAFFKEKVMSFVNDKHESVTNYDLIKLNLFVKDWLIQHIFNEDRKIGDFYRKLK